MHNHNEKTRDMAWSILPSTERIGVRRNGAAIRGRERAVLHRKLGELHNTAEVDDFEGDLVWTARGDIRRMDRRRRDADKVNPFIRWAKQRTRSDPSLRALDLDGVLTAFARQLPDGLAGRHAIDHLRRELEWDRRPWRYDSCRHTSSNDVSADVQTILLAGLHDELNRRLRNEHHPDRQGDARAAGVGDDRARLAAGAARQPCAASPPGRRP